jgi:benzodiazapine receptor
MQIKKLLRLFGFILISELAGFVGVPATLSSLDTWYVNLVKPSFTPPNWIFEPVWVIIFILIGVAAFLIWEEGIKKRKVKQALYIFLTLPILNALWSTIFFGLREPLYAFIEIVVLWVVILITINKFGKISKLASYLLIPYILWVTFAAILNYSIVILN